MIKHLPVCSVCIEGDGCDDGCTITTEFIQQIEAVADLLEQISIAYYGRQYADYFKWDANSLRYEANYLRSRQ